MKKYMVILLAGIGSFLMGAQVAQAIFIPKAYVCHCQGPQCQTLYLPFPAVRAHLLEHHGDYSGRCRDNPRPSPSLFPSVSPTASSSASPRLEPSVSPCSGLQGNGHECGWTPTPEKIEYHGPVCSNDAPKKPELQFISSSNGCARWRVLQSDPYDYATFNYGYTADKLEFGIPKIDNTVVNFETCHLQPNVNIWGQVCTVRNNECRSCSDIVDPQVN
jgi:hypothetical protein